MNYLSPRQTVALDFIRSYIAEYRYPPTLREIGAHMGIVSTNGVNDHMRALKRKGYITYRPMLSRSIRVNEKVVEPDHPLKEILRLSDLKSIVMTIESMQTQLGQIKKTVDAMIAEATE
jgi:SOS-response transcriptional repressor LexA